MAAVRRGGAGSVRGRRRGGCGFGAGLPAGAGGRSGRLSRTHASRCVRRIWQPGWRGATCPPARGGHTASGVRKRRPLAPFDPSTSSAGRLRTGCGTSVRDATGPLSFDRLRMSGRERGRLRPLRLFLQRACTARPWCSGRALLVRSGSSDERSWAPHVRSGWAGRTMSGFSKQPIFGERAFPWRACIRFARVRCACLARPQC